jgi:hypothetical protein
MSKAVKYLAKKGKKMPLDKGDKPGAKVLTLLRRPLRE